jgi:hypothetical protein
MHCASRLAARKARLRVAPRLARVAGDSAQPAQAGGSVVRWTG